MSPREGGQSPDGGDEKEKNLSWAQRMQHVTWAWFTLTMATGGIANVLHTGNVLSFLQTC